MNTKVSFLSRSKLLLLGSAFFAVSLFFGGQANAAFCTWTASSSQLASNLNNWDSGGGTPCTTLTGNVLFFNNSKTNASAVFDVSTTTNKITLGASYSGTVSINSGVTVTTTGDVDQASSGSTFLVGGTLDMTGGTGDLKINGTAFNVTGTINLAGNLVVTTTLDQTAGTFTMSGTGKTISGPGTTLNFYALNINGDTTLARSVSTTGNLTINSFQTLNLATYNLDAGGNIVHIGNLIQTSGTVTMTGATGNTISDGGISGGSFVPYNLNIQAVINFSAPAQSSVTTTNVLTVGGAGSLTGYSGLTINLPATGTPFVKTGTFTPNGSTVSYSGATANIASTTYYNLTVNNGTSGDLTGSTTVTNVLTVNSSKTLDLKGFTIDLSGTGTPFVKNGTLTPSNGTIRYSGAGATNVTAGTFYYGLAIDSTAAVLAGSVEMNNLNIGASGVLNANGYTITLDGSGTPFVKTGTFTASTSTVVYAGLSPTNITSANYYNLTVSTAATLAGNVTSTNVLTISSGKSLNGNGYILELTGTGTPFVKTGTFTASTSTVVYSGGATIASTTYYNLTIGGTTTSTLVGSGSEDVTNNLTINSGAILDLGTSPTLSGNVLNSGTLTSVGGYQLNLSGTGKTFGGTGTTSLYNLVFTGSTTLAGNLTVANNFVNSGTLNAGGNTVTLTKSGGAPFVLGGGTFNANTSTFVYSGSSVEFASTTYYNLTLNNSSSSTLSGSTTVQNAFTISSGIMYEPGNDYLTLSGTGTPFSNNSAALLSTTTNRVNVRYTGNGVNVASALYYNLFIDSASSTLNGNVTSTNVLVIGSGKKLSGSSYTITLNTATGSVFQNSGTFNADTSNVYYANTGSVTVSPENYYTLTLGSGTYALAGNTTSTNSFTNAGTLTIGSSYNLYAPGTYTNTGAVTESGAIIHPATSFAFVDGSGSDVSSYAASSDSVYLKVVDSDANLTTSTDTLTVSASADTYGDAETITLTETGASTGIFQSAGNIFSVASAKTNGDGLFQVSGNGTLSLTYTDSKDSSDTGTDSATFTANTAGSSGGSSGGGGGISSGAGTPPSKISVSLPGNPSSVSSRVVTLDLSAFNAKDVTISEDPAFAGSSWETYTTSKSVTLSAGDGKKTLYIKFRSPSGAASAVYQVVVTLNSSSASATQSNVNKDSTPAVSAPTFNANPDSKVVILSVKKLQYVPNSSVAYSYTFKNETAKTLKIKVLRQVVDADGKVVTKVNGATSIAKGKTFKSNTSNFLNSKLADGTYTVQVKVMDSKGTLLDENSFDVLVKKPAVKAVVAPAKKK